MSRRLSALASWVPEGARVADIGTDHALLPVFLAGSGRAASVIAGDVHAGPVEAARRQVRDAGLESIVAVRQGDGLAVVSPGEADTVVIAGMGGSLMVRILEQGREPLQGVHTLILSPHIAEDAVRMWLSDNDYLIDAELLLEEDGVIYTLIRANKVSGEALREGLARLYDQTLLAPALPRLPLPLMYEMGPYLLREPTDVFMEKWEQELAKKTRVVAQLGYASAPEAAEKAREWEEDIKDVREVLACLRVEK